MRRKILFLVLIIISALLLSACYPGDADYYETRFDELDINGRVNEVALLIENDKVSLRTLGELETIIEDLSSINTHDNSRLDQINSDFISAVKMLTISAEKRQDDDEGYLAYFDMSKQLYNETNLALNQYKNTSGGL